MVSPSLIPGCRLVLFLTSHICWHIYSKCLGGCFFNYYFFIFEFKMKVPQGNYAMGNSHFNKLDSHILLIMVNLIIPFKACLHTHTHKKKSYPFLPTCFFLFLYPSLQTKTLLYVILNFLEKKYSRLSFFLIIIN